MNEQSLLANLRDIQGLDTPPWWYMDISWGLWLLLSLGVLGISVWRYYQKQQLKNDWQSNAEQQLQQLQRNLPRLSDKETVSQLSELLRRIAMARFGREECAGLWGDKWLEWLTRHDPHRFDWNKQGQILLNVPYQERDGTMQRKHFLLLLNAVRAWIKVL